MSQQTIAILDRATPADQALRDWTRWSPRPQIAPLFDIDPEGGPDGAPALTIAGSGSAAAFGEWRKRVAVEPGVTYRLTVHYRTENVLHPRHDVSVRIHWLNEKGEPLQWQLEHGPVERQPDYLLDVGREGQWTVVRQVLVAPEGARWLNLMLGLRWCPPGRVWFSGITLERDVQVKPRIARLGTVFLRPRNTSGPADSVEQFCRLLEQHQDQKMDLVCLPEGISVIGTGKTYFDVAEPIPGPTTRRLGQTARRLNCYIVGGIYERVGDVIYNTAVMIDRAGRLCGTYRKTHLPQGEADGGLAPGNGYPVFQTDFGTVGIMICWDLQFPEPARALALKGAEIILLPIWGGNEILARARAIENHIFLVSSTFDMRSWVLDPTGKVLTEATTQQPLASVEVNLDELIIQPWLGDMRTCTWKERRPDLG